MPEYLRSIRVLEKLGFAPVGTMEHNTKEIELLTFALTL